MEIQLLPGNIINRDIETRVAKTIKSAEALRGCVAFWVIGTDIWGTEFSRLLGNPASFYCVDINKPTNIDSLDAHFHQGAENLYLHLFKAASSKAVPSLPNHLLHAKIMLFNLPNQAAEIWVGSHNLTKRALRGPNKEASIVISCNQQDDIYKQTESYLQELKRVCHKYDPALNSYYKSLQNWQNDADDNGEIVSIIKLLGNNVNRFNNNRVLLLGDNDQDYKSLSKINTKLIVNVLDIQSDNQESLFLASIESSGVVNLLRPESFKVEFSSRPIAIRKHPFIPYQSWREKAFGAQELKEFKYWVNIVIEEQLEASSIVPLRTKKEKIWEKNYQESRPSEKIQEGSSSASWLSRIIGDFITNEESTTVFQAVLPTKRPNEDNDQLFLNKSNSLSSSLDRTNKKRFLQFLKDNLESPYFGLENSGNSISREFQEEDTQEMKEFMDSKLVNKVRLISNKNGKE